jgi:hypothetical protein
MQNSAQSESVNYEKVRERKILCSRHKLFEHVLLLLLHASEALRKRREEVK